MVRDTHGTVVAFLSATWGHAMSTSGGRQSILFYRYICIYLCKLHKHTCNPIQSGLLDRTIVIIRVQKGKGKPRKINLEK
jgi:hypothetical protein